MVVFQKLSLVFIFNLLYIQFLWILIQTIKENCPFRPTLLRYQKAFVVIWVQVYIVHLITEANNWSCPSLTVQELGPKLAQSKLVLGHSGAVEAHFRLDISTYKESRTCTTTSQGYSNSRIQSLDSELWSRGEGLSFRAFSKLSV